ncbi:hypothetical protein Fmac_004874 [Flemingia macrophylla]|uniref:Uncharacterized protein n=1 Tax=Flemingia macrophylla TaxID=520843 RepID=A0ABD1N6C2_9FABA
MAGDTVSSFSTCLVLFLSLLLVSHFTVAMLEQGFSPLTSSNNEGAKKRNAKVAAREDSAQHSKDMALGETGKGSIHVPKREHSQSPSRIFNASAHEVPSGPNPISNRDQFGFLRLQSGLISVKPCFVHISVLKLEA